MVTLCIWQWPWRIAEPTACSLPLRRQRSQLWRDQLWRTRIEGEACQGQGRAEPAEHKRAGQKLTALRRGLHHAQAAALSIGAWFGGWLKISGELKNLIGRKVACFGPLCLSSDSTRCQDSESLSDFQIRRAVRPDFQLPFWTLYFRHYEVGAPSRRAVVWPSPPPPFTNMFITNTNVEQRWLSVYNVP